MLFYHHQLYLVIPTNSSSIVDPLRLVAMWWLRSRWQRPHLNYRPPPTTQSSVCVLRRKVHLRTQGPTIICQIPYIHILKKPWKPIVTLPVHPFLSVKVSWIPFSHSDLTWNQARWRKALPTRPVWVWQQETRRGRGELPIQPWQRQQQQQQPQLWEQQEQLTSINYTSYLATG